MKEIRITLRSEDFAAVSRSMIDLGVSFQVEPVESDDEETAVASAAPRRRASAKKKPSRPARRSAQEGSSGVAEGSGVARLRAMVERNRASAARPAGEASEGGAAPDADTPPGA